jgi:hypothetical protein
VLAVLFSGYGLNPAAPQTQTAGLSVRQVTLQEENQKTSEISTEELAKILADGRATVFDARSFLEYAISQCGRALSGATA